MQDILVESKREEQRVAGLVARAQARLRRRPPVHDAMEQFLLANEHPMLRRSFRSKHFGGALEIQVLRFLGFHGLDPRLRRWWHLSIPLFLVWLFIVAVLYQILQRNMGAIGTPGSGLQATWGRGPLPTYISVSSVFAYGSALLIGGLYAANYIIGLFVVKALRKRADISELALSGITSRELVQALWMRLLVGARVFEVMAGLNLINYLAALAISDVTRSEVALELPTLVLLVFIGSIGARRGAMHALAGGLFTHWNTRDDLKFLLRTAVIIMVWTVIAFVFLPLAAVIAVGLIFADWPLLYYISGWRDFERLGALFEPSALEEGIPSAAWRQLSRLPKRS